MIDWMQAGNGPRYCIKNSTDAALLYQTSNIYEMLDAWLRVKLSLSEKVSYGISIRWGRDYAVTVLDLLPEALPGHITTRFYWTLEVSGTICDDDWSLIIIGISSVPTMLRKPLAHSWTAS